MPFVSSTFFEWWYDSGTPEVRMRYADNFWFEDDTQKLYLVRKLKARQHNSTSCLY